MRVTVTEHVPLARLGFTLEAALVMAVHQGNFLILNDHMAKLAVADVPFILNDPAQIEAVAIAIAEYKVGRYAAKLPHDIRRTDVATVQNSHNFEFAEDEHGLLRKQCVAVRVADNAEIHGWDLSKNEKSLLMNYGRMERLKNASKSITFIT